PYLRTLTAVGDRIVLNQFVDVASQLRVMGVDGTDHGLIPLPDAGVVLQADADGGALNFVFSSLTMSPATYRYELESGHLTQVSAPDAVVNGVVTELHHATAADGTRLLY